MPHRSRTRGTNVAGMPGPEAGTSTRWASTGRMIPLNRLGRGSARKRSSSPSPQVQTNSSQVRLHELSGPIRRRQEAPPSFPHGVARGPQALLRAAHGPTLESDGENPLSASPRSGSAGPPVLDSGGAGSLASLSNRAERNSPRRNGAGGNFLRQNATDRDFSGSSSDDRNAPQSHATGISNSSQGIDPDSSSQAEDRAGAGDESTGGHADSMFSLVEEIQDGDSSYEDEDYSPYTDNNDSENAVDHDSVLDEAGEESEFLCPVCLDVLTVQQLTRPMHCPHFFHELCLLEWFKRSRTCPTCRTSVMLTTADDAPPALEQYLEERSVRGTDQASMRYVMLRWQSGSQAASVTPALSCNVVCVACVAGDATGC